MSHSNHQRRANRTFRVEALEPRALLSTAGVVSRPAAAIAPLARVASSPGDPNFTTKMVGEWIVPQGQLSVGWEMTGAVTQTTGDTKTNPFAPYNKQRSNQFVGGAGLRESLLRDKELLTNGTATLFTLSASPTGLKVSFEGSLTPKNAGTIGELKLAGTVAGRGEFHATGTVHFNDGQVQMEITFLHVTPMKLPT